MKLLLTTFASSPYPRVFARSFSSFRIRPVLNQTNYLTPILYSASNRSVWMNPQKAFKSAHAADAINKIPTSTVTQVSPSRADTLDLSFEDAEAAFKSKTTLELLRSYTVLKLCSFNYLVDNNMKLMRLGQKVFGKKLFEKMMEMTFYGHFVAGPDQIAIQPKIDRLWEFGVKAILDYSVEEDISHEDAAKIEIESSVPLTKGDQSNFKTNEGYTQYHVHPEFADRRGGVASARTFFYMNEAQCERNMEIFIQSIEAVSGATRGTGFAAIKVTALGRPQLLLQLSEVIIRVRNYVSQVTGKQGNVLEQHVHPEDLKRKLVLAARSDPTVLSWLQNMTSDSSGLIHVLPWHGVVEAQQKLRDVMRVPDLETGKMENLIPPLSDQEEEMFKNMMRRLHTIFKAATKHDVRVMVDAEQSYFQPAISRIALEMMRKYNMEKAIVFNTYQCYLKEALHNLVTDYGQAERQNFFFGAKLVRGAYMEQERDRAKAFSYEDPINPNYAATSKMYQDCMIESLRRIKKMKEAGEPKKIAIMAATHNEDSVRFTIQKMKEYGIEPMDRVICFGQLYGMCDQVSFPLGQSGYSVYKYVPYGPVTEVLPYLSRRAQENRGFLGKIAKERRLIFKELRRRLLNGQLRYKPVGNYQAL